MKKLSWTVILSSRLLTFLIIFWSKPIWSTWKFSFFGIRYSWIRIRIPSQTVYKSLQYWCYMAKIVTLAKAYHEKENPEVFVWMLVSRPSIRLLQPIQGQTCHGCINYDKVVGLCSELLIRLSYYIHLGFCKYESVLANLDFINVDSAYFNVSLIKQKWIESK